MMPKRIWFLLFSVCVFVNGLVFAADEHNEEQTAQQVEPKVGSWIFTGMVANESGDQYGYFFQLQKQGNEFYAKSALIDGQTNQLILFYEGKEVIQDPSTLNWRIGRAFIRYNPINSRWVFGVKSQEDKGFNFKVDMLKQDNNKNEILTLRPGVELLASQTSQLNGHIQTGTSDKEQFVTGNNAWFAKLWYSKDQRSAHGIHTTFCRLGNNSGFYSANLREADATKAAIAVWRDPVGNNVKMSQFISVKPQADNQCLLSVALPKLSLRLVNALKQEEHSPISVAGFSKKDPKDFCFVTEQQFKKVDMPKPDEAAKGTV
jgi:hypothetical protein